MGFQSKTKKLVVRSDDMAHTLDAAMHGRKLPANGSDGVGIKSNSQRSPRISFVYATQRATGSSFALIFFKRKKGGLSESCHCKLEGDAAMEIPALLTVLPIDLLFLLSGLAINAVQVTDDQPFCFSAYQLISCKLQHMSRTLFGDAGSRVPVDSAIVDELAPADQRVLGRAAVASASLASGLVGWC